MKSTTGDASVVVMGAKNGRAMQEQDGQLRPVPAEGRLEFAPTGESVAVDGAVQIFQVIEKTGPTPAAPDGSLRVNFDLILSMEGPVKELYYCAGWVVDGRMTKVRLGTFSELKEAGELFASRWMEISPAERNGHLRAYVFKEGKSLPGVQRADRNLIAFKSKLDALDFAGAREWLGQAAGVTLPDYLLTQVAQSGDVALLEMALDRMTAKGFNRVGAAPLLRAAAGAERLDAVQMLLRRKVDPNDKDNRTDTALNYALRSGNQEVIKALLAAGAIQPTVTQFLRDKMLETALGRNDVAAAKLLLEHRFKWPSRIEQESLLARAVSLNRKEAVEFMLQNGVKPVAKRGDVPVVMIAAGIEDGEILAALIKAGGKLDVTDEEGATPFMMAAWRNAAKPMAMLRAAGAPVFAADKLHRTPAAWATMGGHAELALALLAEHPLTGREAARVLHDAILKQSPKVVQAALQQGATLDPKTKDFDVVLAKALEDDRREVFTQSWPKDLDSNPPLFEGWNLAGAAQRLGRKEILADLRAKLGKEPELIMPKPQKLPVEVVQRGGGLTPEAVGEEVVQGEAKIDLFIDSDGVALFPVIRSATPASIGPAAVKSLLESRFSPLAGGSKVWRRVIVPVLYSQENFARDEIVADWELDGAAVRLDGPAKATVVATKPGAEQAFWVRYQVSTQGRVVSPRVLCSTDEKQNAAALEWLRGLRYLPARKDEREVWSEHTGVVLMPSGVLLESGDMVPDRIFTGSNQAAPAVWDRAYYEAATTRDLGKNKSRGLAVMQFLVNQEGEVKNIRTLAASDSDLAHKARNQCASFRFKPGKVDGKPVEVTMTRVVVVGEVSDIISVSETRVGF